MRHLNQALVLKKQRATIAVLQLAILLSLQQLDTSLKFVTADSYIGKRHCRE